MSGESLGSDDDVGASGPTSLDGELLMRRGMEVISDARRANMVPQRCVRRSVTVMASACGTRLVRRHFTLRGRSNAPFRGRWGVSDLGDRDLSGPSETFDLRASSFETEDER